MITVFLSRGTNYFKALPFDRILSKQYWTLVFLSCFRNTLTGWFQLILLVIIRSS